MKREIQQEGMRCNGMKEVAIRYEKYMYTETRILGLSINFEEILERFVERSKMEEEFSSSLRDGRALSSLILLTRS